MYEIPTTMGKMKNTTPIFAIDFEGSAKIGVVEYGVAEICGGEVVSAHTRICAPKTKISARDSDFFGISNEMANSQKPFSADLPLFCEMRAHGIFMAHNAVVEDSFLRSALPSPGIVPDFARGGRTPEWAPWLDTCALVRNLFPSLGGAKLSDCARTFGVQKRIDEAAKKFCPESRAKWHRALYDAIACAVLFIRIGEFEGMERADIPWYAKYSGVGDAGQERFF